MLHDARALAGNAEVLDRPIPRVDAGSLVASPESELSAPAPEPRIGLVERLHGRWSALVARRRQELELAGFLLLAGTIVLVGARADAALRDQHQLNLAIASSSGELADIVQNATFLVALTHYDEQELIARFGTAPLTEEEVAALPEDQLMVTDGGILAAIPTSTSIGSLQQASEAMLHWRDRIDRQLQAMHVDGAAAHAGHQAWTTGNPGLRMAVTDYATDLKLTDLTAQQGFLPSHDAMARAVAQATGSGLYGQLQAFSDRHDLPPPFPALLTSIFLAAAVVMLAASRVGLRLKRDAHALRMQQHDLQVAALDLGQIGRAAAHHLQEPMRKILNMSSRVGLRPDDRLGHRSARDRERINELASDARLLADGIVNYSTLALEDVDHAESRDLAVSIRKYLQGIRGQLAEVGAIMEVDDLPHAAISPKALGIVLDQVIDNAIRYRSDERPLRILVTGRERTVNHVRMTEVDISDNGQGVHVEDPSRLTKLFERGSAERSRPGIGLATARRVLEHHHGSIQLLPNEGLGATVRIHVPVHALQETGS